MVATNTRVRSMAWCLGAVLIVHTTLCSFTYAGIADQQRGVRPNQYIVQFETNVATTGIRTRSLLDKISGFLEDAKGLLSTAKEQFRILKDIDSKLFKGSLVHIAVENVPKLQQMPGVKNVWSNRVYLLSQEETSPVNTTDPAVMNPVPVQPFNVLNMTGVGALHEKGLTGKGVKVAVIDTGLYYPHAAFGNCYGQETCRIKPGYDFVGDNYNSNDPSSMPQPDDDPISNCQSHGTHVAGIIGGDSGAFVGVAPGVEITPYKIFGCGAEAGTSDMEIINALNKAYEDGHDIISMSVGGWGGFSNSPGSMLASQIAAKGTVVVIAAGNDGQETLWAASEPSVGTGAISVGSVDAMQYYAAQLTIHAGQELAFERGSTSPKTQPFVMDPTPLVRYADDAAGMAACESTQTTFEKAVVLVARGTCNFQVKIQNAIAQGAGGVIIVDNTDSPAVFGIALEQEFNIPITTVTKATGEKILALFDGQSPVQVSAGKDFALVDNPTGGEISPFSSYGPSYAMDIKPEIMAPGGSIFSTLTLANGLYGTMSGTSMATPFIAGCIALLMEAGVERNPEHIKQLLMSTADPIAANNGPELATVAHQGAGLVNMVKAVSAIHQVSPSKLALLDPAKGGFTNDKVTKEITVTNRGQDSVTYDLSAVAALSVTSFNATKHMTSPIFGGEGPQVQLNPAQITVGAGQSVQVNVEITQPSAATQANLVYSGFVQGKVSGQTDVAWSIPLMGLNGDYSSLPFFTPTEAPNPGVYSYTTKKPVTADKVDTFIMANRNFPVFSMQVQFPISSWEWYVAEEASPDQVFLTIESGAAFVRDFIGKSQPAMYAWTGIGTDKNGVNITAPNGNYMFVLSYTTPLGDPAKPEDKLSWKSPIFTVNRG